MSYTEEQDDVFFKRLLAKYTHKGCPAVHYEDVCDDPGACAEKGRCRDLPPINNGDNL
jgi:hypothetical protein